MAEQDWLTPATAPTSSPYQNVFPEPSAGPPAYELRPLTLGELLDRTFSLYRSRFWLFAGIAAVSGLINLLANVVQIVLQHFFLRHNISATKQIVNGGISLTMLAIFFLAYSVTQAATVHALSEVYLGKVATIGTSLRAVVSRWYIYAAISLWQWWSMMWLPMVLVVPAMIGLVMPTMAMKIAGGIMMFLAFTVGAVVGLIFFLRNSLAIQANVEENLTIRKSMRRSKVLSSGAKWRIFVVGLIAGALYLVVGAVQMPLLFVVLKAATKGGEAIGAQAVIFLIAFLGHTLVSPVALIGLSLVYFDQRVRKEAFDIAYLLGEPVVATAAAPAVPSYPAEVPFPSAPVAFEERAPAQAALVEEPWKDTPRATDDSDV